MALFLGLLNGLVYLIAIAIDVVCFFILVRFLAYRFKHPWLTALNHAGEPLLRGLLGQLQCILPRLGIRDHSEHGLLAWGFVLAAVVWLALGVLMTLIDGRSG